MSAAVEIPSVREQVSDEEWQLRVDLAACYRLVAMYGWDDMIFTHISARIPGPEHHFLINPYGMLFEEITASSLVKIDLDGNILMDTPYFINPAGFTIHSAIHAGREDAHCVLHLHTDDGVAVSSHKDGLKPLNQLSMLVTPHLAYHDYEGVALNHDECPRLVADLGDKHLMILRNHGTLAVGQDCPTAFMGMYFLERACAVQVAAFAQGECYWPKEEVNHVVEGQSQSMFEPGLGGLAWPALLRKLDRLDPSYRD